MPRRCAPFTAIASALLLITAARLPWDHVVAGVLWSDRLLLW